MMRWRVQVSRHTPTWFHAVEVRFLDAPDADTARSQVEAEIVPGGRLEVWDVRPATVAMEASYRAWQGKVAAWFAAQRRGENPRGIL